MRPEGILENDHDIQAPWHIVSRAPGRPKASCFRVIAYLVRRSCPPLQSFRQLCRPTLTGAHLLLSFAPMALAPHRASWSRPALVFALYLGLAAAGLVWSTWRGHSNIWRIYGRQETQLLIGTIAGLLIGLGIVFASRLAVHRFEWARSLHRDFRARLGPLLDSEVIVLAAASSLGEEIFFRGALLPATGLVVSSAVFALLHVGPKARYLPWTVSSFVAGLMFGQLFLWSGDLTGAVVAHFTVNYLNLRHLSQYDLR